MNKFFILAVLTALASHSSNAAVVTMTAEAVTVIAGGASASTPTPVAGSGNSIINSNDASTTAIGTSPAAVPATSASSSPSTASGPLNISWDDFLKAWTNGKQYIPDPNISSPTQAQYNAFIKNAGPAGGITSKAELAMFFAEIMFESGGLIYKAEIACKDTGCPGSYTDSTGIPGKYYYGYIQLTWGSNYKAASMNLFQDDRLLQDPDQVATNEDYAWGVSFWFWKTIVKPALQGTLKFGLATNAINGALECRGTDPTKAKNRFKVYTEVLKVFDPASTPIEAGCYN